MNEAVHEAGHATAVLALGGTFDLIRSGRGVHQVEGVAGLDHEGRCVVALAGYFAELLADGHGAPPSPVWILFGLPHGRDLDIVRSCVGTHQVDLNTAVSASWRLVREHLPGIAQLATELQRTGVITQARARGLLRSPPTRADGGSPS